MRAQLFSRVDVGSAIIFFLDTDLNINRKIKIKYLSSKSEVDGRGRRDSGVVFMQDLPLPHVNWSPHFEAVGGKGHFENVSFRFVCEINTNHQTTRTLYYNCTHIHTQRHFPGDTVVQAHNLHNSVMHSNNSHQHTEAHTRACTLMLPPVRMDMRELIRTNGTLFYSDPPFFTPKILVFLSIL